MKAYYIKKIPINHDNITNTISFKIKLEEIELNDSIYEEYLKRFAKVPYETEFDHWLSTISMQNISEIEKLKIDENISSVTNLNELYFLEKNHKINGLKEMLNVCLESLNLKKS